MDLDGQRNVEPTMRIELGTVSSDRLRGEFEDCPDLVRPGVRKWIVASRSYTV